MILADQTKVLGLDRSGVLLHGCEQLANVWSVDLVLTEPCWQCHTRGVDFVEYELLLRRTRPAAEFGDEIPDGARLTAFLSVPSDVSAHQPDDALVGVPVRRCRVRRTPLIPVGIGRLDLALLVFPVDLDGQVRIEPREAL